MKNSNMKNLCIAFAILFLLLLILMVMQCNTCREGNQTIGLTAPTSGITSPNKIGPPPGLPHANNQKRQPIIINVTNTGGATVSQEQP